MRRIQASPPKGVTLLAAWPLACAPGKFVTRNCSYWRATNPKPVFFNLGGPRDHSHRRVSYRSIARSPGPDKHFCSGFLDCAFRGCDCSGSAVSPLVSRSENILQNFLFGILLLLQEPFQLGDLLSVTGIEGNVHDIQARARVITTKGGRPVVIPNAILFTSPVALEATAAKR